MVDFNKYKSEISLPDFLVNEYNFSPVKGSTKRHPKLKHPDTGETFIIKKNSMGQYTYFDIHNDSVKGFTILDFLITEHERLFRPITLIQAAQLLDNYMVCGKNVTPVESQFILNSESLSPTQLLTVSRSLVPLSSNGMKFFINRGIEPKILSHPLFNGVIFEKSFLDKNRNLHLNVVFRMQNINGDIALSQRNANFKGCLGQRINCLASSDIPDVKKQVERIYFGESMIDCISHFSLNFDSLKDRNIAYLSSEGNITSDQLGQFQCLIEHHKYPCFTLLFDDDLAGHYYSANTLASIKLPQNCFLDVSANNAIALKYGLNETLFEIEKNRESSFIRFSLPFSFDISEFTFYFTSCVNQSNNKVNHFSLQGNSDFFVPLVKPSFKSVSYQISFPTTPDLWKESVHLIHALKFAKSQQIVREMPLNNDFNDDLKKKQTLPPLAVNAHPIKTKTKISKDFSLDF